MSAISPHAQGNCAMGLPRKKLNALGRGWGVEVKGFDFEPPLTPTLAESLRSLLNEHQIVFFRHCHINHTRLLQLARLLGEPEEAIADTSVGYYRLLWQSDRSFRQRPHNTALVHAPDGAPEPCERSFLSSASLAYDSLPEAIKRRLEGVTAIHRADCQARLLFDDTGGQGERHRSNSIAEHPVLQRHPFTGQCYLNINEAYTQRLIGLPIDEGRNLLALLLHQFYRPEQQIRLKWTPGSLALWDPRIVQHYGPPQLDGSRVLVRIGARLSGQH